MKLNSFEFMSFFLSQLHITSVFSDEAVVFKASYQADYFTSPGFPFGYPNNIDCVWILKAPEGKQVEVVFIEVLTESCCDIIELRDGNTSSAGLLVTYRGNVTESIYVSSFGSLYVRFHSDESYVGYGFLAEYRIATTRSINCTMELRATDEVQFLHSPGWPFKYASNLHCTWTIRAPEDKSVSVVLAELDTERCCDYVLIRFGETMTSQLREFGGAIDTTVRPTYVSPGETIQVIFRSDSSIVRRGFSAEFKAVKRPRDAPNRGVQEINDDCGGKLEVPLFGHHVLTTPRYPMKHENNLKCVWVLVAPKGRRVMLWFTSLSTEACCDFVKIRDGESPTSTKLGVLSGQGLFSSYVSSSNILRVDFESDINTASRGFRAVYEVLQDSRKEACGGIRKASVGKRKYLSSPNWPSNPMAPRCDWYVTAPLGYSILFQVIGFHSVRNRDQLHFYDGVATSPFAIMAGRRRQTLRFISSSNTMTVVFKSDFTTTEGGFRAFYTAIPKREAYPQQTRQPTIPPEGVL